MPGNVIPAIRRLAHRGMLHIYRRLPVQLRRRVVRTVAPTYTAGAIAVLERADGRILLVRQVYRQHWGLPGGLLAKGEAPMDAVVREVHEELGLDVTVHGQGAVVLDVVPRRFDFVYRATVNGPVADTMRPVSAELEEAAWFPVDALPELQFESRVALEALRAAPAVPHVAPRGRRRINDDS